MNAIPMPTVRDRILLAARDLILSKGFSAMTVENVCAAAGVTKGGFFHHFGSKEALGEAALAKFWLDAAERQGKAGFQNANSCLDYVIGYLDHAILDYQDPVTRQGCMLAIFTMELADTNPLLYGISARHFQSWRTELIGMFEKLRDEQALTDFDAIAWSELFIATLEGALLLSKSSNDTGVLVRALTLYKRQLLNSLKAEFARD